MPNPQKKILGICGSTKSTSSCLAILKHIASHMEPGVGMHIYDGITTLPHFNPELTSDIGAVEEFRELIAKSDGLIFCTPEYVFSLPGSLKNAIEWLVSTTLLSGKTVAIIVGAASGKKAFESLNLIMTTLEAIVPKNAQLLIPGVAGKIEDGSIINDQLIVDLKVLTDAFTVSITDTNRQPTKYRERKGLRPLPS